jgi:hypothetical protein
MRTRPASRSDSTVSRQWDTTGGAGSNLNVGAIRLTVREALALGGFESKSCTFPVIEAKRDAVVVAESYSAR